MSRREALPPIDEVFCFMENEIWKDIPNYEGLYQVSNLGRVKSLPKKWIFNNGTLFNKDELITIGSKHKNGYLVIFLSKDKNKKFYKIHQLVAMAFLGHTPCGMLKVIDHINEIKTDNRLDNLQIISHRENVCRVRENRYTSKYKGVTLFKESNKWRAQITINNKVKHLGLYKEEIDAHNAYQNALKQLQNDSK